MSSSRAKGLMQVFYSSMTSSMHRGADRHGPGKSQCYFRGMRKDKNSTIEDNQLLKFKVGNLVRTTNLWSCSLQIDAPRSYELLPRPSTKISENNSLLYVGYSESKYRLRISLAHPRDCHFAHVQWLPLSIEKPQTPFREIRLMFMFVPVR